AGDDLIVHVAATLRNRLRETDALARLGGDEFAVLLDHVDATAAQTIAQELCQAVATTPLTIEGTPVFITLSAGVTVIDPEIRSVDEAMVAADVAMYDAKEQGRNRAVHYEHEGSQRRHMTDGLRWSQRLHQALEQDGISLHAQPIVDLSTGDVAYHEVLMRLHGDDGTVYEPAEFLPIAERFGYAPRLDRHVIDLAVDLAIRHPTRALTVNLSGTSITDPTLGDWIEARIAGTTCRPGQLVFEITETEAIANMEEARRLATRLQRMGCRLALDDFGSGFASFYHLKTLPIDLVKIDGEFVRRLGRDSADRLVVEAVQRVARGFGKDLVAEHVESAEAADVLRELGVRYAQGYYFGRPGVAETMLER
uniref:putative bifunctional diguanylate cyclase/phosphodiesterase n=1 Tax=Paraconexibacter sp. TaxID=2949640 RepID=UPI003569434D